MTACARPSVPRTCSSAGPLIVVCWAAGEAREPGFAGALDVVAAPAEGGPSLFARVTARVTAGAGAAVRAHLAVDGQHVDDVPMKPYARHSLEAFGLVVRDALRLPAAFADGKTHLARLTLEEIDRAVGDTQPGGRDAGRPSTPVLVCEVEFYVRAMSLPRRRAG